MSSTATPFGASTNGTIVGAAFTNKVTHYKIKNAYGTSIFYGDFVKWGDDNPNTTVQKDTGTTALTPIGVFLGCAYTDPNTKQFTPNQYFPASTAAENSVDISTVATTNTLPVKIIGFVDGPDSEVGDAYTDVLVMFNVGHQLLNATGIG